MWKGNKTWWEQLATGILVIALVVTVSLSGWIGVKARGVSRPNLIRPASICMQDRMRNLP